MKKKYKNAKIYTMNSTLDWANEMIVEDGKITYVGDAKPDMNEEIIDCEGKMLMPSFIDSHCHPGMVAYSAWHIVLPLFENVDDLLKYVKEYAEANPDIPFLYFDYYATELFDENGPKKELLDDVLPDRPCMLIDFTEHMAWVNSTCLELMGVDKNTEDPDPLRVFWRDKEGNPTGWIKEGAHIPFMDTLYENIGWYPPSGTSQKGIAPINEQMHKWGYTGMFHGFLMNEEEIQTAYELDRKGELNFYYDASIRANNVEELPAKLKELDELKSKYSTEHITFSSIKLFVDGTMASGNTAMLEPLSFDETGTNYGTASVTEAEMEQYFRIANEAGYDVHLHVLGDRSFRMICDCVERIKADMGDAFKIQIVIAHACLVNIKDRLRPAKLGIYINMTPHWSAGMYGESSVPMIGPLRWAQQAAYNEMIYSGANVACSTDTTSIFEFNRSNPLMGIQCGATRVDPEYPLDPERFPESVMPASEQRIEVVELLKGFTINGARQMHIDNKTGSLEEGKSADFIILSDNLLEIDPGSIMDVKVEKVFFEGKQIV